MSAGTITKHLVTFVLLISSSLALGQSETPATVPASFVGTYETTFESFNPDSPIATATAFTVVIGSDNSLCVNGTLLTDPVFRNGNTAEGIWKDSANSLAYAVSNFNGSFNEINVAGIDLSPFYGQMSGSKVSDSTVCDSSSNPDPAGPVITELMNQVFALAETKLPEFFPAGVVTLTLENYVYRFYPETSVYLAFADDTVFLLGGAFGEAIVNVGPISAVLSTLEGLDTPDTGTGSGVGTSIDLWTLTISGTFNTPVISNVSFAGITIADVPAPDLDDTQGINTEINSTLAGVASGISSISITVVNNSETQRTFDVSFNATVAGFGAVTYNLRYDYTR